MYIQIEWCEPNRLYDFNEPILCWTKNNRCITFNGTKNLNHWEWIVEKYGIVGWMYQFRLKPECLSEMNTRVNLTKEQELDYFN